MPFVRSVWAGRTEFKMILGKQKERARSERVRFIVASRGRLRFGRYWISVLQPQRKLPAINYCRGLTTLLLLLLLLLLLQRDVPEYVVSIVTTLRAGRSGVQILAGAKRFSLLQNVETGLGAHPTSYSMGAANSFIRVKAAGTWSWPLTSIQFRG
jgi:hypothetical protein